MNIQRISNIMPGKTRTNFSKPALSGESSPSDNEESFDPKKHHRKHSKKSKSHKDKKEKKHSKRDKEGEEEKKRPYFRKPKGLEGTPGK